MAARAGIGAGAALAVLLGCGAPMPSTEVTPMVGAPAPRTDQSASPVAQAMARRDTVLRAQGRMRTDPGRDIALGADALVEIWREVALQDEYLGAPEGFRASGGVAAPLRRWAHPVRYRMEFGAGLDSAAQARDHAQVASLVAQLAQATNHPISLAPPGSTVGNYHVLVLTEHERRAIAPRLRALVPGIDAAAISLVVNMPLETACLVMAFARGGDSTYSEAVAIIRAEHPDLARLSCYHEELTQGLGLANDSPRARPSIFNDDQEFALITWADLALLRLHYDPRLRPGMTAAQSLPLARIIASELVGGDS